MADLINWLDARHESKDKARGEDENRRRSE
jgi:hypothetical protein